MCVASLAIGTENVTLPTVWHALTDYRDIGDQWIVHDLRIPRTVLALLVGLALGLSGTLIQAVGRNPLADSEILGINSGAALFVVCAIAFLGLTGIWTYIWFAFAGALFAMLLVYLVGMTGRATVTPVRVLLAGVAIGAVMDGIGFAVRLRNPRAFDNMRFWDAGALDGRAPGRRRRDRPVHRGRRRAVPRSSAVRSTSPRSATIWQRAWAATSPAPRR